MSSTLTLNPDGTTSWGRADRSLVRLVPYARYYPFYGHRGRFRYVSSNETTGYIAAAAAFGGVVIKSLFDAFSSKKTTQLAGWEQWREDCIALRAGQTAMELKIAGLEEKIDHLTEMKGEMEADRDRWRDEAKDWKGKSEGQGRQIEEMRISLDVALRGQEAYVVVERERQRAFKESTAASKPAGTPDDPISIIPAPNSDPDS